MCNALNKPPILFADFYHQPPNAQLNLSRGNSSNMSNSNQHISGPLASGQGPTVVSQGALQQSQQAPAIHSMSMPLSQNGL